MARVQTKKALNNVKTYGAVGLGVVLANKLSGLIPIENQLVKDIAPVVAGAFLAGQKGMIGNVGGGLIAGGVANSVENLVPGLGAFTYGGGPLNGMTNPYVGAIASEQPGAEMSH